jgi:hypothetical protein
VDVISDTAAHVIGAVVTAAIIVGAIVLDVVSFGGAAAATPAEGAAVGALWSGLGISLGGSAATMLSKAVIKGGAYGWEDIGTDAGIGLVDALLSVVTAGTAGKVLKGSSLLTQMAERRGLAKVVAKFVAHAAEGAVQSAPGALLGGIANKQNFKDGNAILNILEGAALQVGGAAVLSGGVGAFHGILKDELLFKARTDPTFQEAAFQRYSAKNRGATRADFLANLDHLITTQTTLGFKDPKMQEQLRARVLEHIPMEQRGAFKNVPVRVLSEDEFKAFARSDSGNAVTIFHDGKPTVVVKAGTDLSLLGEEGIHLSQAKEPATAPQVRKLDESVLQHWDKLDIDTQLDLYKTKLELEIDAHERLAQALEEQKAGSKEAGDLDGQIERTKTNLENLRKRQSEVAALSPEDELEMQAGIRAKPQYLDQPARLFAKDPTIPAAEGDPEPKLRPIEEVRQEFDSMKRAESKGPLTEDQQARLHALEKELQGQYVPQKGENLLQMEKRLLDQRPNESLKDYRERLESLRAEVERGGNIDFWVRYENLLADVKTDVEKATEVRTKLEGAKKAFEEADRVHTRQRRARNDPRVKIPEDTRYVSTKERNDLGDAVRELEEELKGLETRGSARSRAYEFGDIGKIDPCFAPGTLVATPDGERAIDFLRAGDLILAYDWRRTIVVPRKVLNVHRNATSYLVQIRIGENTIEATREHPFWLATNGSWQAAKALVPGDVLQGLHGQHTVDSIQIKDSVSPTVNIEVDDLHNFFVGATPLLVHNGTNRPDFSDVVKRPNRIYQIVEVLPDGSKRTIYIGKTRQGGLDDITTRFEQHIAKKPAWKKLYDKGLLYPETVAEGTWTEFETAVWEKHHIDKLRSQGIELENDAEPVSDVTFKKYKSNFKGC